ESLDAFLPELVSGVARPLEIEVGDDDVRSLRGERAGCVVADAAGAAGDDDRLLLELHGFLHVHAMCHDLVSLPGARCQHFPKAYVEARRVERNHGACYRRSRHGSSSTFRASATLRVGT